MKLSDVKWELDNDWMGLYVRGIYEDRIIGSYFKLHDGHQCNCDEKCDRKIILTLFFKSIQQGDSINIEYDLDEKKHDDSFFRKKIIAFHNNKKLISDILKSDIYLNKVKYKIFENNKL